VHLHKFNTFGARSITYISRLTPYDCVTSLQMAFLSDTESYDFIGLSCLTSLCVIVSHPTLDNMLIKNPQFSKLIILVHTVLYDNLF